ncbi:breast cancer type 1 susceptibility protein homolog isoform X1 [Chiloscyllium punctatum]|uniref:breast cancer type 1 susceptibility protein homolog isoform X1 n=1 Tax=Chiloscyllium punctatum TaxID=137246 RepID=UPI003B63C450
MSLCKSEIEHVHKVLSLMLKNLECPICLELMKEPVSTKCDHQFCRFCILKLFNKKNTIPCPLCKNIITKRSLQESTRFKQLTEGIMKMIHAFQLDTGYEFSIDNTPKLTPSENSAYRDLWQDDTQAWGNNTPQNVIATGISKNRTLNVCSDPPLTEFVRRVSTRNKRQKVEGTTAYVGIDSDSSEEPLFKTHINIKSTLRSRTVNMNTTPQKEKIDQCDNDEKPYQGKKSKLSKPILEELFSSKIDDNVTENTENTDADDYSCATGSETEQKQMTEDKSVSNFCSPEAPGKVIANENSLQVAAEWVNKQNCTAGDKLFTERTMPLSEKSVLEKDADLLDSNEKLNQKVSNQMVKDETDFQTSVNQSKNSSVPQASRRKSQRIMKVSEWLSNINVDEVATLAVESNPCDQNVESDSLAERVSPASEEGTSSAEDTENVKNDHLSSFKHTRMPKTAPTDVKNKIFAKTYKRDKRKSVPVNWSFNSDNKSDDLTPHREGVFIGCNKTQKTKRKSNRLNPEDFIKRTVNDENNHDSDVQNASNEIDPKENVPESKDIETEASKEILDESSNIKQIDKLVVTTPPKVAISNDVVVEDAEQNVQQLKLELCKTDGESKKKLNKSLGRKGKKSSINQTKKRTKPLQLVNHIVRTDRSLRSDPIVLNENKIDSFPSSEEVKVELETRITRRSNRLKLLDEELIMQDKNKGKKSKLTRSHSIPSPCANFAPFAEPSEKNTDVGMVCAESENLPNQDIIVQACKDHVPDADNSQQEYGASHGSLAKSVGQEFEGSAVHQQLKDCHKAAETEDAAVSAEHPLCSDHSSFIAVSDRHSKGSSSEASLLLLAPQPVHGEKPGDPQLHCSYVGKDEVTPCGSHSRVGTIISKADSREDVSIKQQTSSKETNEDSEVDTELLLKSFRLSKRRSFILMPATEYQAAQNACATAPDTKSLDNIAASNSEEINTEGTVIRDTDGNVPPPELEEVNSDKIDSPIRDAKIANDDKSEPCTSELDNVQQLSNRENCNSVEIVPPTVSNVGLPLSPVLPQYVQEVVPPSRSRLKGKRNTRLLRRKGSNCSSSPVTTEKEIVDSDRSSEAKDNEHFNSNAKDNSWCTKTTKQVKTRGLEVAVSQEAQHNVFSTRLESSAQPESELLFSARDLLGQEASEKDNCQENTLEKLSKEREFYKTRNLLRNGPLAVKNTTENKLDNSADVARCHSLPTFMNSAQSTPVKNKTSENKCSQIASITPDGLLDGAEGSRNNISTKSVDELDEMQSNYELREYEEQLRQHEVAKEKPNERSSTQDQLRGRRKRPVKLSTSESETSDEELPCFQIFGFNRSRSNAPTVSESPSVTGCLSLKDSLVQAFSLPNSSTEVKKTDYTEANKLQENVGSEGCLKNECLSPSQESGESPDLFSSQSDGSSLDASPQPKISSQTLKQINALSAAELENREEKHYSTVEETVGAPCLQPPCLGMEINEGQNIPGNGSEASHTDDSSPESEILTTQQRRAIQDNIKKLEREMAVLEAVLDEHGSQDTEHLLSMNHLEGCPELTEHDGNAVSAGFHRGRTENLQSRSTCLPVAEALNTSVTFMHEDKEESECPKSLGGLEFKQIPEKLQAVNDLLNQFQAKAGSKDEMIDSPNAAQKKEKTKVHVNPNCEEESQPTENVAGNASTLQPENENTNRKTTLQSSEQSTSSPTSSPVFNKTSNAIKNSLITVQSKMSLVASGLNKNENMLVEMFARKTGAEFLSTFSSSTTHVIMKTDTDLVCERTLKYFMGIAGRRWVVSYQWIIECFRKGMVIDEHEFEVKGDVINGRSHTGPRKARKTADDKLLLSHYEVCCFGSFTGMSRDQLEWMVELCGASIIKEPYLFTYSPNRTAVVVVQPDANPENTDYRAIQRQYSNFVVSREWILDSVACYQNHQLEAYLVCVPH